MRLAQNAGLETVIGRKSLAFHVIPIFLVLLIPFKSLKGDHVNKHALSIAEDQDVLLADRHIGDAVWNPCPWDIEARGVVSALISVSTAS